MITCRGAQSSASKTSSCLVAEMMTVSLTS
jgi:hypothetical protein